MVETRELSVRMGVVLAQQEMIISRLATLEALHTDVSVRQTAFAADLGTLEKRQSASETSFSSAQSDISQLLELRESVSRIDRELSALKTDVGSIRAASEAASETLFHRVGSADERLSRHSGEIAALHVSTESLEKDLDDSRVAQQNVSEIKAGVTAINTWALVWDSGLFGPPMSPIDSRIIAECPPLFEEFRGKKFNLKWRGSRDGFDAGAFHSRCNGVANTLTIILDTDGNVFGGFTPVSWESRHPANGGGNCYIADHTVSSFIFTLRNPHKVPARKFRLRPEKKDLAILSCAHTGPLFGPADICVEINHNVTAIGTRYGDRAYENDTAFPDFLTGSQFYAVKEVEVFQLTD
jgi:hypothetical protein